MSESGLRLLVTGGAGFIGCNFIRFLFEKPDFDGIVVNLDALTYAGNLMNLEDISRHHLGKRYFFEHADICDKPQVKEIFAKYDINVVVHFAAESHVDRSILGPEEFIRTNVYGTFVLLEEARRFWASSKAGFRRFHHISTDEVYGSLGPTGYFYESTPYDPRSPYSASKAGSDHLVRAYYHTYGLPISISNCSNNYGPYQFPEKLIPLMILNMLEGKALPVYGDGLNIRDWLYVQDHCEAVYKIITEGKEGQTYNIGGQNEWTNIDLVTRLCEIVGRLTDKDPEEYKRLITFVKDRPGHDRRYAINCDKIKEHLNWSPSVSFTEGLTLTVKWYLQNMTWVQKVKSGEYQNWLKQNYSDRTA